MGFALRNLRLKSNRVYLRPLHRRDAATVFAAIDRSRAELEKYLPWTSHTRAASDTVAFIRRSIVGRKRGRWYTFGVFLRASDEFVGVCGLVSISRFNQSAEIGYWVASEHAGRGYTTEAAALVLRFAFELLDRHKVVLRAATDNPASNRVALKLGFTHEGIQREEMQLARGWLDLNYYSLLRTEYLKHRAQIESFISK